MTMSFFGKLKSLHNGPPAPPKRTGNHDNFEWPREEFDEEESDMYEAPPCERPAVKVPPRHVEENVYLETTGPVVPQRQGGPPPRPGRTLKPPQHPKELCFDPNTREPPEIDRNDKPGRKKTDPPPVPSAHPPLPAADTEEEVYLDPNEDQDDSDDLYLEPAAACPPDPCGAMRMPPPAKLPPAPSPLPLMKPPVPRVKSSPFLPSLNEGKAVCPFEARHATFPTKLPPPTPSFKPPLPANLKEVKPGPPYPHLVDTKPATPAAAARGTKHSGNEGKEWFAGDCNRRTAQDVLLRVNRDGAFLVRHSSARDPRQPFTLAVLFQQKVYNIPIRFLEETHGYVLGKEGKKNEEVFTSLDEMISHHKNNQLFLIDSKSQAKHTACLTLPVRC